MGSTRKQLPSHDSILNPEAFRPDVDTDPVQDTTEYRLVFWLKASKNADDAIKLLIWS